MTFKASQGCPRTVVLYIDDPWDSHQNARCVVRPGVHILAAISSTHLSKKPLVAVQEHDTW